MSLVDRLILLQPHLGINIIINIASVIILPLLSAGSLHYIIQIIVRNTINNALMPRA